MAETSISGLPVCRRCGRCCESGGPALHRADLPLVEAGKILRRDLVTLRAGEVVHENVAGGLTTLACELVKLAGRGSGFSCRFHDAALKACAIHDWRPVECRALFCEETTAIEGLYREERATRADMIAPGGGLWELVEFHELTWPAAMAVGLARKAARGDVAARESLAGLASAEAAFREAFRQRAGIASEELDFYFGRSLRRVCAPFGTPASG
ncbi:MAG: YkgJ family cysteine cluster protein [Acidobacteriota bacterium]